MRRLWPLVLATSLALAGCGRDAERLRQENETLSQQLESLQVEAGARDRYLVEVSETLTAVTSLLDQMQQEEIRIGRVVTEAELKGGVFQHRGEPVTVRLQRLGEYLEKNAQTIDLLEERLGELPIEVEQLQQTVSWLRIQNQRIEKRAAEHVETITALKRQVRRLSEKVAEQEVTIDEQEETIGEQQETIADQESALETSSRELEEAMTALTTGYVIVGSQKELTSVGIVERMHKRNPLLRKRLRLTDRVERLQDRFTAVSTDRGAEIALGRGRGKVRLVPDRPPNTYALLERGGIRYLDVRKPDEFWVSKYVAVIID